MIGTTTKAVFFFFCSSQVVLGTWNIHNIQCHAVIHISLEAFCLVTNTISHQYSKHSCVFLKGWSHSQSFCPPKILRVHWVSMLLWKCLTTNNSSTWCKSHQSNFTYWTHQTVHWYRRICNGTLWVYSRGLKKTWSQACGLISSKIILFCKMIIREG